MLWRSQRYGYWESFKILFALVSVLVAIEAADEIFFGDNLFLYGVKRGDFAHWHHLFFAPFIHDDWPHVFSNSAGLLVLGGIVLLLGARVLAIVTLCAVISSGLGVLFLGSEGIHAGASSIVYGYFGFLIFRGIYEKSWAALLIGAVVLFAFQGLLSGMLPGRPGTSWHSHLFGSLGGIAAAGALARGKDGRPRSGGLGDSLARSRRPPVPKFRG